MSYIGDMIDPATRTTPVRIVTQNPEGLLKKDLFVDVVIHDKTTQDVVVVPTTAVLYDEQNFPFVYVQRRADKFAQRQVKLGSQQGADTQIGGLKPGEPVVSQGSVFLQFANTIGRNAMINRIVSFALAQRFIVIVAMRAWPSGESCRSGTCRSTRIRTCRRHACKSYRSGRATRRKRSNGSSPSPWKSR